MQQVNVRIEGHVQGVFFRASTREVAQKLNIRGWVMNRPDGSVEALFAGDEAALGQMLLFCLQGPERARVEKVVSRAVSGHTLSESFDIKR